MLSHFWNNAVNFEIGGPGVGQAVPMAFFAVGHLSGLHLGFHAVFIDRPLAGEDVDKFAVILVLVIADAASRLEIGEI